jgi:hypothetical protein
LSAAGGVESGAVENERRTGIFGDVLNLSVELVEERVVVVEASGHGRFYCRCEYGRTKPLPASRV